MGKKLWDSVSAHSTVQGKRSEKEATSFIEEFMSGEGVKLDQVLVKYDLKASWAHAKMLSKVGLLTSLEFSRLKKGLKEIEKLDRTGSFRIKSDDEDCHTAIENKLVELVGEVGKKIHAGRSRNDQVLVALKLYVKEELKEVVRLVGKLNRSLVSRAKKYQWQVMPGYTHMQKAMPTTVGLWLSNFAWLLKDDLELIKAAYSNADQCPLGSAAAYGVSLPLDRKLTSKLLGFARPQMNVLSCANSRGKLELSVLQSLTQVMVTLSRLAQDVLLFTSQEFDYFTVDESLRTGSSIMPNKRNVDVMELVRARAACVSGWGSMVAAIVGGLPSGYNADVSETKEPLMKGIKVTQQCLKICRLVVRGLIPKPKKLKVAMTSELFATYEANQKVLQGIAFRDAYRDGKEQKYEQGDSLKVVKQMKVLGGPGNLV